MSSARKFLALALAACQSKQFEEAGVFLAQASVSADAADLAELLGNDAAIEPIEPSGEIGVVEASDDTEAEDDAGANAPKSDELDWGDEEEFDSESVSTVTRRKTTSVAHIGKIIAASMSASLEEDGVDDEDDSEETWNDESDPDFVGEALIPASFSSVKVKSPAVQSPVRLKTD